MSRLMDHVRPAAVVQKEIDEVHARAKPIRELRERLSLKLEEDKKQVKDLSQQILSIELPIRELHLELMLSQKKAGKEVFSLPAT